MTDEADTKPDVKQDTPDAAPKQELMPSAKEEARSTLDRPDVNLIEHSPFNSMHAFGLAQRMSAMLASSSIVPDTYRTTYWDKDRWVDNPAAVGNCFIAIELANRLHTSPILIMQQVDMIHGRPALRGTLLIGLINASKLFSPLMFEQRGTKDTDADYGYRAVATNLETGERCEGPWIDWKMVRAEGWPDKKGSKWKTMPEQMFRYRAAAFWSRIFAPHITLGLYEAEEAREVMEEAPTRAARLEAMLESSQPQSITGVESNGMTNGDDAEPEKKAPKPRGTRRKVKDKAAPAEDSPAKDPPAKDEKQEKPGPIDPIENEKPDDDDTAPNLFNVE